MQNSSILKHEKNYIEHHDQNQYMTIWTNISYPNKKEISYVYSSLFYKYDLEERRLIAYVLIPMTTLPPLIFFSFPLLLYLFI